MASEGMIRIASAVAGYQESNLPSPCVNMEGLVSENPIQSSVSASSISLLMGDLYDNPNICLPIKENPPVAHLPISPPDPQPHLLQFEQSQSRPFYNVQQTFTYEDQSDNRVPSDWDWEVTSKHSPTSKMKFSHLLPQDPLPSETLASLNMSFQVLPEYVKEDSLKYAQSIVEESKIQKQFFCTGWKGKLMKKHVADEETFLRSGMCKECLFGAFDEMTKKQNKQTMKEQKEKIDETMIQIETELKKLDLKSRQDLESAIPAQYRTTGLEMKDRLRGIGMGHHPENKSRKLDQFEHNSVLALYGFDVQCVTLVYDHRQKNIFLYGAPEIKDSLIQTAERLQEVSGKSKTHLDAATSLFKTLFMKSPRPPIITPSVQSSASTVWNNAFAVKKNTAQTLEDVEILDTDSIPKKLVADSELTPPPHKKAKISPISPIISASSGQSSKTSSQIAEFSDFEGPEKENLDTNGAEPENKVEIIEGIIEAFDKLRCSAFKVCEECFKKNKVTKLDESIFPHFCYECCQNVQLVDHAVITVEIKLKNTTGVSTDKAFIQLAEEYVRERISLLPKESQTATALIGQPIGPMWMELNEEGVWAKYTPVLNNI